MIAALTACLLSLTPEVEETLPTTLRAQEPEEKEVDLPRVSIGVHAGWLEMKDAEDGEVFYGAQVRLYLLRWLAVEGSVDVNKQEFIDDDAELTTVPVQLTGLLFPFPDLPVRPYALAGVGWYFQDVEFDGPLETLDDEDDNTFGFHVGAGVEILLGRVLLLYADVRYVWLDDPEFDTVEIEEEDFDFWQAAAGIGIAF